jgi:hypothetical protein
MVKRRGPPSQGWQTFLRNHAPDIAAMDLFVVPTIGFKLLYGFVIVRLDRRAVVWINVTTCYSAWGPDADRHDNSLILLTLVGSCFGADLHSAPLRAIALGAPIEGQRGTSTKREGYWIRSCLCKNCIADRVAFGGCHEPPRGSRGERRAAVVLNAKRGTEAPRQCLSWVSNGLRRARKRSPLCPRKRTSSA